MKTVSCIIPAYNEAPRVAAVLEAVAGHPLLSEVLVIDDGSTDETAAIADSYKKQGVTLLRQEKNCGKTAALVRAIRESRCELLLFIDADLENLTRAEITSLLSPVLENRADVSISLRKNAPFHYRLLGLDFISGERVLYKKIIEHELNTMEKLKPFGLEVFLNRIFLKKKLRIAIVRWPTVNSPYKYRKVGIIKGILGDMKMSHDILDTVSLYEILHQMYVMRFILAIQ